MYTSTSTDSGPDGSFEFKRVPPGKYRLGIRLGSFDTSNSPIPYPRLYYPGVTTATQATVITVKEGTEVKDIEMRLPQALTRYSVEGLVVWSDGQPAANVNIYLNEIEEGQVASFTNSRSDEKGGFIVQVYEGLVYKVSAYPDGASGPSAQSPWVDVPALHGPKQVKLVLPGVR
jgi:hypothetical protein